MRTTLNLVVLLCGTLCTCSGTSSSAQGQQDPGITYPVDSIVIVKNKREMYLYNHRRLLKVYHVCLGPEPAGPKHFRNDGKTPEGLYRVSGKNPHSHYHKCLAVSYPSAADIAYAKQFGRPAGGDIKIHGLPNGKGYLEKEFVKQDWTLGCIALTDDEIDELYAHVTNGAWVNILP